MDAGKQEQDIAGKMSERSIPLLIFAPTSVYFSPIQHQFLCVPGSFGKLFWQRIPFLLIPGDLLLQLVNLSAGTSLLAIEAASIKEEWPTHLVRVVIHSRNSE